MEEAPTREPKRLRQDAAVTSAAAAAEEPQYVYLPIADAMKVPGVRVCLFAVVSEIGITDRSRGTDFTLRLRIVDQSCMDGISVTVFADKTTLLPCVKSSGDVISLHNVMITMHGEFFVSFNKEVSSFALFESKVAECSPYQTSVKYHGSKHDKELLTQMRTWLAYNPLGLKDFELQLRSLKSDSTFDLVCKVVHVHEDNDKLIFYVWDGTDTPAVEFQATLDPKAVESPPLFEGPPLPREVLCTMPIIGTVLRIFSDMPIKEVSHMQNRVYWARFCNITCKEEFGIWKGILLASSKVRLLSHEDGSVVDRRKMYAIRKANQVLCQPMASFPSNVTDVEYEEEWHSTLMQSLTHKEVTHKLKTLARVVGAYPCQASGLRLLSTGNIHLRLTLEDPTARIHAYVHKNYLVQFFGGFLTEEAITKKMNKLLGIPEPEDSEEGAPLTRNPPWIWCCLTSFYMDKNNPWDSRKYRIFATEMRD
ncbi:protection of telomeres protein 1b isoform X1 [Zea mays]|uniref:protection of telomeres protein 1b isoform X1 n=1 Tax=Zea mays TaxID=4577 RepID=UPI0004DEB99C|nr:uncharacterized protein LOC100273977 isoform X1 [Zea mays]|eukprot:XP_008661638.1 uncharacterized protein LOC100273977 isoform X1 [Zea mays]